MYDYDKSAWPAQLSEPLTGLTKYPAGRSGRGQVLDCSMTEGASYIGSWLFKSRDLAPIWGLEHGRNW